MTDLPAADGAKQQFLVVGIGGSAGSITSFREFFRNVPADSGMAYVVILHLSPDHESRLAEVLQQAAKIPVLQVRDSIRVEPDRVYVIPPNRKLAMDDGTLVLSAISSYEERRAPIDIFFRTLADEHDSRAVCVIMSGSGSDGSMGLRRVKEYNGLVLVQDPAEAAFGEMPRNSIATGLVDYVVPVAEMPRRIIHHRDRLRTLPVADGAPRHAADDEQALMEIFTLLRLRTGHDFLNYKRPTVLRRIVRRMAVRDVRTLPEYAAFLRDRNEEAHALLRELLISVTNFFRDPEVWAKVEQNILPKLLAAKLPEEHVRVWVPGCATGEEAYTMAMLLAGKGVANVQLFATDLDEQAIVRARDGWYNETEVADVPSERLRRFFVEEEGGYRVQRELRELVLFAHHNLIKDPPFSHLDFISCRNLLIYLNRAAQQRALEVMHFALNRGGYLLLGTAEAVDGSPSLYSLVDKEAHLYQRRAVERAPMASPLPRSTAPVDARALFAAGSELPPAEARPPDRFAPIDLHHRLLEQYAAPSLVVDEQQNVVHISERAGRYLQIPRGEATSNVLELIRQELRVDLRSALFQAAQKRSTVAARGVSVHTGDRAERIDLVVHPALGGDERGQGLFLVVFEEAGARDERPVHEAAAVEPGMRSLEDELLRVRGQMRAAIEQYEVQAEEAKAANEELQAMNEELRSTAEELETSQEELQSVNEELQTVNQELKVKIDEISHASDDLRNLMSSTDIGTIFVDRGFRVKLFTPRARQLFNLIPADVGRPLSDITNKLLIDGLADEMAGVLGHLQTLEREVQTDDGAWYLMRLLPYRTSEDRIGGVVLTFLEITERHRAEAALRTSEAKYRMLFESIEQGFCTIEVLFDGDRAVDYRFLEVNPAFQQQTGITGAEGRSMREIAPLHEELWFETYGRVAATGESVRFEGEAAQLGRWFEVNAFRVGDPRLRRVGILFNDITGRRRVAERLRVAAALDAFRVELNDALRPLTEPAAIREAALRVVGESLQVDRVLYVEVAPDGETFVVHENYTRGGIPPLSGSFPVSAFPHGSARLAAGHTLAVEDVRAEASGSSPGEEEAFTSLGVIAAAAVPLVKGGRWMFNLCAQHGAPRVWTADELERLRETAERTWAAVERAQAEAALRESEARLHAVANLVPDLLWMSEPSGATNWYNDRWLEYTGQTPEEASGRGWTEIVHPDDRAQSAEAYRRAVAEGRPLQQEHRIRSASGEYRWFLVHAVPFRDRAGRIVRYYGAATDIHEQRMTREQLEQRVRERTNALLELSVNRQQLLERLVTATEEERQRIARELHDEMGQHITALRVGLDSLAPSRRIDELKAIITRIDQSIDRLTLELRPPALDQLGLHGAITSLADEFSAASGIRVALHLGLADSDRFAEDIESALYRVLQESLTNVWKHAAAKTVSVILEREKNALRMIIEDDGHGFDADGTAAGAPARGRFGLLGMRERLALVGGTFDVESEADRGATIYVHVPLAAPERGA